MDLLIRLNKELDETFVIVTHSDAVAEMSHRTVRMRTASSSMTAQARQVNPHGRTVRAPMENIAAVLASPLASLSPTSYT